MPCNTGTKCHYCRMRRGVILANLIAALLLTGCTNAATKVISFNEVKSEDLARLSPTGSVRWNFEALLHQKLGSKDACTGPSSTGQVDFPLQNNGCSPLSIYSPFFYTFEGLGRSRFHLMGRWFNAATWELDAGPVLIGGRLIACDPRGTQVLIY